MKKRLFIVLFGLCILLFMKAMTKPVLAEKKMNVLDDYAESRFEFELNKDGTGYELKYFNPNKIIVIDTDIEDFNKNYDYYVSLAKDLQNNSKDVNIKELVVPDTYNGKPVTSIGNYAINCGTLETIKLPESIEKIGDGAFSVSGLKQSALYI